MKERPSDAPLLGPSSIAISVNPVYWSVSSYGSKMFDPSMTVLSTPWADPVVNENIMYSGHLLLMMSLYTMLLDGDIHEQEGGLVFD